MYVKLLKGIIEKISLFWCGFGHLGQCWIQIISSLVLYSDFQFIVMHNVNSFSKTKPKLCRYIRARKQVIIFNKLSYFIVDYKIFLLTHLDYNNELWPVSYQVQFCMHFKLQFNDDHKFRIDSCPERFWVTLNLKF